MYLTNFVRLRAARIADPYNPSSTVESWVVPDESPFEGFFDDPASTEQSDPVRSQETSTVTVYVPTASPIDIVRGDRVRLGTQTWQVTAAPPAPRNPFTGSAPWRVLTLDEVTG